VLFLNACQTGRMLETSVRLFQLLTLLQVRRDWSGADLADRLGVTTRTVRNDIERLRILGYQVHSSTGTTGGYRLGAGSAIPPLLLDDDEAVAVGVGLWAAAAGTVTGIEETSLRALSKLEQSLPARLRHRLDAFRQGTVYAAGGGPSVDAPTLTAIAAACRDHEQLRFDYRGAGHEVSARRLEPHRLVFTGRRWYLLGWDRDREDWRTFRADRIRMSLPAGPRFTPREPPEDVVRRVVSWSTSLSWKIPAVVRLSASAQVIAERIRPESGELSPVDEHSCILKTGGDSLRGLVSYLTGLDVAFEVLEPPELRTVLRELADRYAAAAGDPVEDPDPLRPREVN
jgi:predicted DNA-binding transcriptional regulator YafY